MVLDKTTHSVDDILTPIYRQELEGFREQYEAEVHSYQDDTERFGYEKADLIKQLEDAIEQNTTKVSVLYLFCDG